MEDKSGIAFGFSALQFLQHLPPQVWTFASCTPPNYLAIPGTRHREQRSAIANYTDDGFVTALVLATTPRGNHPMTSCNSVAELRQLKTRGATVNASASFRGCAQVDLPLPSKRGRVRQRGGKHGSGDYQNGSKAGGAHLQSNLQLTDTPPAA